MKKTVIASILLSSLFIPAFVFADATYSCAGGSGSLAPITVSDPINLNAAQVSAYITNCTNSGGTASGPSAQQLQTSANDRVSQGFSALPTPNTNRQTGQANGTQTAPQFCQNGTCTYTSLEPLPLPGGGTLDASSFPALVSNSFKLLIGAGGVVAVVMIVLGALTYMFSDIVGSKTKALARIRGAMWAVVLLVSSYLILVTINPELVKFSLNLDNANNFTDTTATPATRVPVTNPSGITIHEGPGSYDKFMDAQAACQSPKVLRSTGNGSDSQGKYTVYECKQP